MIPVPFFTIKPCLIDCLRAVGESLRSSSGEILEILSLVRDRVTNEPIVFSDEQVARICSVDAQPEDVRVNYPFFAERRATGNLLHDEAVSSRPFCLTCSRDLFDGMGHEHGFEPTWACRVRVPKTCLKCCGFGSDMFTLGKATEKVLDKLRHPSNYEVLTLRMVEEEYLAYTTNCELKAAKDNRALHLAVTQLWSRSEKICSARLGFIQLLPSVVTLQQSAAFMALPSFTGHWLCSGTFRFILAFFAAPRMSHALQPFAERCFFKQPSLSVCIEHAFWCTLLNVPLWMMLGSHLLSRVKPMVSMPIAYRHGKTVCHATQWYVENQSESTAQPVPHLAPEHNTVSQEARCEENGGAGEARICPHTPADLQAIGGQGNLNPQSIEQILVPNWTIDGKHLLSADSCLWRTAPSVGNVVCFAPNAAANVVIAQKERIGGPSVPTAPQKFEPNPVDLAKMWAAVDVVLRKMLTQSAINTCVAKYGDVCGCGGGRYGEAEMQRMVNDILGDVVALGRTTNFVKLEKTIKPNKPPRLVQDNSPFGFTLAALVVKVFEDIFGSYDKPLSIKKRRRDVVLDAVTEDFSADKVRAGLSGRSKTFIDKIMSAALVLENDMTTFEYTQNAILEPGYTPTSDADFIAHSKGFLVFEMAILKHIGERICIAVDQLNRIRSEKDGPKAKKGKQTFSMRERAAPYFAEPDFWRLTLDFLVRRSGDTQTSIGNRFCSLLAMATAFLKHPADLFHRLVEVSKQTEHEQHLAKNWLFEPRVRPLGSTMPKPLVLWMPRCEGDDYCGLHAGWGTNAPDAQFLTEAESCLRTWGLLPKFLPVTKGRAEFVGAHFLVEGGFLRPGLWTADLARTLTGAAFTTSDVLRPENGGSYALALAYFARAAGFRGRVDPAATYMDTLGKHYWALAQQTAPASSVGVVLDWSLASACGGEYGALLKADDILQRLTTSDVQLSEEAQKELAEASLGGPISNAEWATWTGASHGVVPDDEGRLVLGDWPKALRDKCESTWK